MFQIPNAGSAYLYQKPINMRWGEKKLTQLCLDEMGIDPGAGGHLPELMRKCRTWEGA